MNALYRFNDVCCAGSDRARTFTLHGGETRVLQLASRDEKNATIDCAIGEERCAQGSVEIVQGDRRRTKATTENVPVERRRNNAPVPLVWLPLRATQPERVGWVAPNGGLISNLRIWENVTLPLWYRTGHEVIATEQIVARWLGALGLEQDSFEEFMAAHPHRAELWQRKLAGLLRALVLMPPVLVVDVAVFANIKESFVQNWIMALESYAAEGRAVLVVADKTTTLHWQKIE